MATVKFYLKNIVVAGVARKGEVTISANFTLNRRARFQIKTEQRILVKHWDSRSQCVKSNCPDHISINLYLQDFKRNLIMLYRENHTLTFPQFRELARNQVGVEEKKTLWHAWKQFFGHCQQDKDEMTCRHFTCVANHLESYETQYNKRLDFGAIDWNFYDSFRSYLYSKGVADATAYKYISMFCTFLRWASQRGYPTLEVFKQWKFVKRVRKPVPLTLSELEALEAAILPRQASIGRDYLVFECRTGQRISDIQRFNLKDFADNKWTFNRKKGNSIKSKTVTVHFVGYSEPALRILERHNFQLPKMSEQKINKNIKEACELAGIKEPVTIERWVGGKCEIIETRKCDIASTHMGRRTFITLGLQYMPPKVVKDLAGIDSYQTLKHYEGNSETEIIKSHLTAMSHQLKAM